MGFLGAGSISGAGGEPGEGMTGQERGAEPAAEAAGQDQGTGRKRLQFCSEKIFQAVIFLNQKELTAAPCSPQGP